MPNGNLQSIKDPKVREHVATLRKGYLDKFEGFPPFEGQEGFREYAAYLRTQTKGASSDKWEAIQTEMPTGYALDLPNPRRAKAVDDFAQAVHDRFQIPHTDQQQEKVWAFAEQAVSRLGLTGQSPASIEQAVEEIAAEQERLPNEKGSLRKALDRVMEARFIETLSLEEREARLQDTAVLLQHGRASGPDKQAIATTHGLLVNSLAGHALSEGAKQMNVSENEVVSYYERVVQSHQTETVGNVLEERGRALTKANQELISAGMTPTTAHVLSTLANREWCADREQFIANLEEARADVQRVARVKPVGKYASAEDAMLDKIVTNVRAGDREIDLSTLYKTTSESEAQRRHDSSFRNLSSVIPQLEEQGYSVLKGSAEVIHAKDVSRQETSRMAIGMV